MATVTVYKFVDDKTDITEEHIWLSTAFTVNHGQLDGLDDLDYMFSTADIKFTDTTPGGNTVINPISQYCRYTDPRRRGVGAGTEEPSVGKPNGNFGMGDYYSETHDDYKQELIIEAGVPSFTSMFSFMTRGFDYAQAVRVNDGRIPWLYYVSLGITTLARIIALPGLSFLAFIFDSLGFAKDVLMGSSDPRYFTLKPDMLAYLDSVNTLATYSAVELGLLDTPFGKMPEDRIGVPVSINTEYIEMLNKMAPGIVAENGYIDVYKILTRTSHRMLNHIMLLKADLLSDGTVTPERVEELRKMEVKDYDMTKKLDEWKSAVHNNKNYVEQTISNETNPTTESGSKTGDVKDYQVPDDAGTVKKLPAETARTGYFDSMYEYYKAALQAGGTKVRFRVDFAGDISDSFSNSVENIGTQDMMNSVSSKVKEAKFSMAGGNFFGDLQKSITDGAKDILVGAAEGLTFGISNVIMGMFNGGFIEMPQAWGASEASLAEHSFSVDLIPTYNNPIGQLLKMHIPLFCIMALMLPRQTGLNSHGSPFYLNAYMRGRVDIPLGMMTSLTVTRAITNLPFNANSRPLGVKVDCVIKDLSTIYVAPVPAGILASFQMSMDDKRPLNRFMNALGGRDYYTHRFIRPKALMRMTRAKLDLQGAGSEARLGIAAAESPIGDLHSLFIRSVHIK